MYNMGVMTSTDELKIPIRGTSMLPTLREGDQVLMRQARFYWPGQILVFVDRHGQILCHRLMAIARGAEGWQFYMTTPRLWMLRFPQIASWGV
jgi:signal peptidase I